MSAALFPRGWRSFVVVALGLIASSPLAAADRVDTIRRVKASVVAVGTFDGSRVPAFQFRGTGFVVAAGTTIVTNAHVLPGSVDAAHNETLAILTPASPGVAGQIRPAERIAFDPAVDLALLRIATPALPALDLADSDAAREGQDVLLTGFPIGAILGAFPVTHHGMISAITPIAIPQERAADLRPALVRRLGDGAFPVFQLDATAYPGNSGSPIYDPETGEVLGIVNMVLVKKTKEAALSHPSGITYAVPAKHLKVLLESASHDPGRK